MMYRVAFNLIFCGAILATSAVGVLAMALIIKTQIADGLLVFALALHVGGCAFGVLIGSAVLLFPRRQLLPFSMVVLGLAVAISNYATGGLGGWLPFWIGLAPQLVAGMAVCAVSSRRRRLLPRWCALWTALVGMPFFISNGWFRVIFGAADEVFWLSLAGFGSMWLFLLRLVHLVSREFAAPAKFARVIDASRDNDPSDGRV